MKQSGAGAVLILALVMITGLSVMYWKEVGEKLITVSSSADGIEFPICAVKNEKPEIAVTFDVKGGKESIQEILETLEKQQVKATFFVTGVWAERYPECIKQILEEGHDLGSSGENGAQLCDLSAEECRKEIMQLHKEIRELTGYEMKLFRPPYGGYDNAAIKTIGACGYYPIAWSIDSMDWKNYGQEDILRTVTDSDKLKNGAIILCRSNSRDVGDTLEKMVEELQRKGYTLRPLSQMLIIQHLPGHPTS